MAAGNRETNWPTLTRRQGKRPTIGFISNFLSDRNCYSVWQGVIDAARERDANVITFLARDLGTSIGFNVQANVLYDMVSTDVLDGLVAWNATLMNYTGPEGAKRMLEQYRPIPMVTIESGGPEDIPRVEIDSYQPMREMVAHLIQDHGYRRIAFIRGPDTTHTGARQRYQAYLDALAEYGLPLDPDLVSPPSKGLWGPEVGEAAISLLLDQRGVNLEAVAAANDLIAIGAMRALQARGIHVPTQVAVTGFDDETISNSVTPPLTTISLQGYEHARQATEMLLTLLDGGEVPKRVTLPPKLIIRQSCGCGNLAVVQAAAGPVTVKDEPLEAVVDAQRETILSEMRQAAGTVIEGLDPGWAEQLLEAFFAELKAEKPGVFLSALDEVLRQVIAVDGQVAAWANVISALRRCVLPHLDNNQVLQRADDLWLQAQVMVGETAQLAQRCQALQAEQRAQVLDEISAALIITFDVEALMDTLAEELPRLGIPSCYLSLYQNPQRPTETSRLIMAYDERRGRLELEAGKQVFPSRHLVPEGMLPQDRPYNMVVEALYFREEQLGFVLFEVGPRDGPIYDTLREQISSALQGARITQQVQRRALQLQTGAEVSRAASSILDPEALIQQVVELARERFDLYYVGLFLVDQTGEWTGEPGRWAVLQGGTGEAGRQMVAQAHKLEVGGESMIGWCIANKQARIALDVGEEAVRFENPLLPETRSELALPLVSRGEAIGALTIQSAEEAAFTKEDIAVLQTMADQLANAIANARLYEQAWREIAERKAAEEALRVSEERFALAVQGSNDGIYDWDIANNTLYWSPRMKELLGYADDELDVDFDTFDSLLHPDDKEHTNAAIEAHLKDRGVYDVEQRLRTKSGEYRWFNARGQALWDEAGNPIRMVGSTTDITERKAAEEKIEHLNLVLSAIRNVNQLITRERDRDRLLQGACETLIETRGYHSAWIALLDESEGSVTTAEAGLGGDFLPLVERLKRGELTDCVQRALKQSGVVVTQDPSSACADCPLSSMYNGRGAVTIRLEYGGKVYGLLSVSIPRDLAADEEERALFEEVAGDIAFALHSVELEEEHKAADEALAYERHLLKTLMDNLPDAIYFKDTDSRFIRTNQAHAKRWFSLSDPEQAVGKSDFDFFSEEHAQQAYADEQEIVRTGQPLINVEEKETWPDGRVTWVSTTKMPLRDAGGQIIGTFGITRDITERKAAEAALKEYSERLEEMVEERTQELRDAQEQLVRREKLAVLGQMAGGVGHELRNPLGAISNAVYFLNMVLEEPEPEVEETLEILEKEVKTSETIISSLLDFARAKPPTRRKVDINDVVREALSRIAVPENVEVVRQLDEALPIMLADPDQLVQVFGNIILNAIQAMPEGGRLVVKSEGRGEPGARLEWVAISIADTGVGISEEGLGKLFEPLFTTKAKGVGLGLAVTKTLVEGHGGSIEVESPSTVLRTSEVGVGTTFTVRLPVSGS